MNTSIKIEIDRKPVSTARVYVRDFNYGRPAPECLVLPYRLSVKMEELFVAVEPEYREYAEDDLKFPEDANPIDAELRRLGWPPLATLVVMSPNTMRDFFMRNDYLVLQELLGGHYDPQSDPQTRYAINSVVSIEIEKDQIVFSGDALVSSKRLPEPT